MPVQGNHLAARPISAPQSHGDVDALENPNRRAMMTIRD